MADIGGEHLVQFVSVEYETTARAIYNTLHIGKLTLENVWVVFQLMMPLMYP